MGKKLMIVKEVLYLSKVFSSEDEDSVSFSTQEFIAESLNELSRKGWRVNSFIEPLTRVIWDTKLSYESIVKKWDYLVFYYFNPIAYHPNGLYSFPNYTPEEVEEYQNALIKILDEYKPDIIILCGTKLYNLFPSEVEFGGILKTGGEFVKYKRTDGKISYVLPLRNPDCLFNSTKDDCNRVKELVCNIFYEELGIDTTYKKFSTVFISTSNNQNNNKDKDKEDKDCCLRQFIDEERISISDFETFINKDCQNIVEKDIEWMLVKNVIGTAGLLSSPIRSVKTWVSILNDIRKKDGKERITESALEKMSQKTAKFYVIDEWNMWNIETLHKQLENKKVAFEGRKWNTAVKEFQKYKARCQKLDDKLKQYLK